MNYYAVTYDYADPDQQEKHRPAHRQYLSQLHTAGKLVVSGPFLDGGQGALLIFKAESAQEVEELLAQDPMFTGRVVLAHTIRQWNPVLGSLSN